MREFMFNLQLFAGTDGLYKSDIAPDTTANFREIDSTTHLSIEMKTFYSKDLLETVAPNLVHAQFGEKVTIPKNSGRHIEWRQFSRFSPATNPLTEGITPEPVALEVNRKTVELHQYGSWSMVSDLLDLEAIDKVVLEYTKRHAENAAKTLDTLVRDELVAECAFYTIAGATGKAGSGNGFNDVNVANAGNMRVQDIARVATYLKNHDAPTIDGSYVAIVHPSVSYDIQQDSQFINVAQYNGGTAIYNGEIGKLYGVRFVESTTAYVTEDEDLNKKIYITLVLGRDAYKVPSLDGNNMEVIVKNPDGSSTNDPLNQRSTIGWKCNGYATCVTLPEYMYGIISTSSLD